MGASMAGDNPQVDWLLRLGDSTLVLAHRLSEWCGHGPAIEEDLALSNVALDLLGQARMWFTYAGELEGAGRDEDKLAYLRDAADYRNLLLVEQPNGDYADTMARQFYFDVWHRLMLAGLTKSADRRVAEIAEKSLKEVTYHQGRSSEWVIMLGDGTSESHDRMQAAIDDLWIYTGEMFEMDALEEHMVADGIGVDLAALREPWFHQVSATLDEATLTLPEGKWMQLGGKRGVHTENLGYLLAEMQFLQRAYPNATW